MGLVHSFASAKANTSDATKVGSTSWNDDHQFTGGNLGAVLYQGTAGDVQAVNSVATGQVLTSAGAGSAPAWSASPTVTAITAIGTGAAFGFGAAAGGTVTQATSKSTGVTLNRPTGEITMNAAALAGDTAVSFTLTDSSIAAGDYVLAQHVSAGTVGSYLVVAVAAGGSATITVRNITTGSLSEAIVVKFVVIRAVTT